MSNRVYLARTFKEFSGKPRRFWVLFDGVNRLSGEPGETKASVIARWKSLYGTATGPLTSYTGVMRPSELAMTIAAVRREAEAKN